MKLVEAKQPALFCYRGRGALDWIELIALTVLELLPEGMNTFVHVGHEFVKMNAPFADDRAALEEQIHQHGLAAADLAVAVKAFDGRSGLFALTDQLTRACRFARQPVLLEPPLERSQAVGQYRLTRIRLDLSRDDQSRIAGAESFGHASGWLGKDSGGDVATPNEEWLSL